MQIFCKVYDPPGRTVLFDSITVQLRVCVLLLLYPSIGASSELELWDDEKLFLKEHPTIRLCVDPDWMPYEKLDEQGRHVGIIAEYMKLMQERIGLKMNVVITRSWSESQALAEQRKCDVLSGLNQTQERGVYLSFTEPYIRAPAAIAFSKNNIIKEMGDLNGKTVALVKDYVYDENLRLDYPKIIRVYVKNVSEGLRKVEQGEIDAVIGLQDLMVFNIYDMNLNGLQILEQPQYQNLLRVGIRNDYPELYTMFTKAVASLKRKDYERIRGLFLKK